MYDMGFEKGDIMRSISLVPLAFEGSTVPSDRAGKRIREGSRAFAMTTEVSCDRGNGAGVFS